MVRATAGRVGMWIGSAIFCSRKVKRALTEEQQAELARLLETFSARGAYHKILPRQVRRASDH